MLQVIQQTDEEKFKMYNRLPKKKIIEMLIECHRLLDICFKPTVDPTKQKSHERNK